MIVADPRVAALLERLDRWQWVQEATVYTSFWPMVGVVLAYVVTAFGLVAAMRNRKPMSLKALTIAYNVFQVVLSAVLCLVTAFSVVYTADKTGWWPLLCEPLNESAKGIMGLCLLVYHLNKYVELLDTIFLCLRKKRIIFLHVFHHGSMVPVTWFWLWGGHTSSAMWCVFINCFIHILMYYYYLKSDLGQPPRWKQFLTMLQIIQLSSGQLLLCFYLYFYRPYHCQSNIWPSLVAFFSNSVLIVFFIFFFISAYTEKPKGASARGAAATKKIE
eukprot:TRINITY_DN17932_c0_g1_i1.p1 TRINITY_DN17932_c0_g1~~TRINITY_DN17932_c0_g1_i1.p1  ORF type:complete len:304 (-),score=93.55 TRINITY_DN17932_c0_g1_i1:63-884(-)